uniref:hypothetical protein n=1 Tax=Marinobacterium profundum TaxID=1714300 RepID=UPI00131536E7|nr:hypothetical protein [Marinobacterium profundum]
MNKATGERVPDDIMLVAMRKEISRLQGVIADLKRKDPDECPIYGPLKRRGNGAWRGD